MDQDGPKKKKRRISADNAARQRVDEIFRQWQTERPDIDPVPVQIYGLIGRLHIQSTAFIDDVLEPYGLVRGTFDVLTALRRAGAPYNLTPKELTQSLLLSGAGLNSRLNKLEAQHYIARLPQPTDRRTIRIQLTASGEAVIDRAIPDVFNAQWARLNKLDKDAQHRLIDGLLQFADILDSTNGHDTAPPETK
ncbi:MarR family transcriptional regulator [Rhizobiaceae bacterium BDR2-2]|uniref:MarR family transcriptional regulator n=1 Tax=Ectorhizobium quercum TaxID=2965071 RepID=A0AAE3MZM0_9HYPH|nr:MarR family transcriptional regulator [Ectorhizobium quercum]MCX8997019.1 MarR family transcriptional regulator [Ectorhizobium quercum]